MRLAMRWPILAGAAGIIFCYAEGGSAQPILATGPEAEATSDGLHRVDRGIMETAWVRPDLNLGRYRKILFMPTVVAFRAVEGRYNPRTSTDVESFPVSDEVQARFRQMFGETFHDYVAQVKPYLMADNVGRDVLMVQGFLIDVISGFPPNFRGSSVTATRYPWEATVMLELRDSMSDTILARTSDRQRVDGVFYATEQRGATQWTVEKWSELLRMHIGELLDIGGGRWSACQLQTNDCGL